MSGGEKKSTVGPSPASSRNIAARSNSSAVVGVTLSMPSCVVPSSQQEEVQSRRASELSRINAKLASKRPELSTNLGTPRPAGKTTCEAAKRDSSLPKSKPLIAMKKGAAVSLDSSLLAIDHGSNKARNKALVTGILSPSTTHSAVRKPKAAAASRSVKQCLGFPRLHKTSSSTSLVPSNKDSPVPQDENDVATTSTAERENTAQGNDNLVDLKPNFAVMFIERTSTDQLLNATCPISVPILINAVAPSIPEDSLTTKDTAEKFPQLHVADEETQFSPRMQSFANDSSNLSDLSSFTDQQLAAEMKRRREMRKTKSRQGQKGPNRFKNILRRMKSSFKRNRSRLNSREGSMARHAKSEVPEETGYGVDEYSLKDIRSQADLYLDNTSTLPAGNEALATADTPSVSVHDIHKNDTPPILEDSILEEAMQESNTDLKMLYYPNTSPRSSPKSLNILQRPVSESQPATSSRLKPGNLGDIGDNREPPLASHMLPPPPTVWLKPSNIGDTGDRENFKLPLPLSARPSPTTMYKSNINESRPRLSEKNTQSAQTYAVMGKPSEYSLAVFDDDNRADDAEFFRRMMSDKLVLLEHMKCWRDKYSV